MNILIAEPMAQAGVELLRGQPGWTIIVSNSREFTQHLANADALVIRFGVQITPEILKLAPKLRVIGRAGVSVDNVNLSAATAAGVLVMNTPGGNAVSVAEHTIALMLSLARFIPQANASTKGGAWERKKFFGSELSGKTLGIIGLGSVGRQVVKRARAFDMRVVGNDPFVTPQIARDLGVELAGLSDLCRQSDYITIHVSLTPNTDKLLGREAFAQMKTGVRIVNCARGELLDEAALCEALESGKVAGAALDVFVNEPADASSPLFGFHNVLATPHIGGATEEAQATIGLRIAEQIVQYLQHGIAINAVNMPSLSPEQYKTAAPFIDLAERLGKLAAHLLTGNPHTVSLTWCGHVAAGYDGGINTNLLRNAGLAGVLSRSAAGANVVNAMQLAADRGWKVAEVHDTRSSRSDAIRLEIETDSGLTTVEGSVVLGKPRLMLVDGIYCEAPLSGTLVCMKSLDLPGVIGHIGTLLGSHRINIANFSLGRRETGEPAEAISILSTDSLVPQDVLAQLLSNPAVKLARSVAL